MRIEQESHEALVGDNGRPCYPIELAFEVISNLGQYKKIIEYWQMNDGDDRSRMMFTAQLKRWKRFRDFQGKNRRHFLFYGAFPEFQQEVLERRRRYGLDGGVQLLEDRDEQSKLDDWMEYQDYELRHGESMERDLAEAQAQLASKRKPLVEAGLSAFEEFTDFEFNVWYDLAVKNSSEEGKAEEQKNLAKRKLRLAEERLKTAESDDLGERVERVTWEGLFLKEVESAKMRVNSLQHLYVDAKRKTERFHTRWIAIREVWAEEDEEDEEDEEEDSEFKNPMEQYTELQRKNREAWMNHSKGIEETRFREEGYNVAQLDSFGETIERATLIKVIQEEVRSAKTQFEEAKRSREKVELQEGVLNALQCISDINKRIERHTVLLEWIEQQRREITTSCTDTGKEGDQSQTCDISQAAEKTTTDTRIPKHRGKQVSKVKDTVYPFLRSIHSSRVSKLGKNEPSAKSPLGRSARLKPP